MTGKSTARQPTAGSRPGPSLEGFLEIQAERCKTRRNLGGGGAEKPDGSWGAGGWAESWDGPTGGEVQQSRWRMTQTRMWAESLARGVGTG